MSPRTLVVDANVLLRAVLGQRVSALFEAFAETVNFLSPESAFGEARQHMAAVLAKRGAPAESLQPSLDKLDALRAVVRPMALEEYESMQAAALARIGNRDPDDWPVLACALAAGCPVWTEDRDFFGTGVATWRTATVEVYLGDTAGAA